MSHLCPSGEQFAISGGGYDAVLTESGATLRSLSYRGRPVVDGFGSDEIASGGRGQLLAPWPNRLRDGRYTFAGTGQQLGLTEPARRNASHGLVRWVAWTREEHTARSVSLRYRLMAQTGYPWTVDLHVVYDLSTEGLTVTQTATNLSRAAAPYASGAHPYLSLGDGPIDGWVLRVPASTRSLVDDRKLPVGRERVAGTAYDFRSPRPIGDLVLDDAFTDLERDPSGRVTLELRDPASGRRVALWGDRRVRWLQLYSADDRASTARRSLAVEPMTANADALASGEDLIVLAPAGEPGEAVSVGWGIRALQDGA